MLKIRSKSHEKSPYNPYFRLGLKKKTCLTYEIPLNHQKESVLGATSHLWTSPWFPQRFFDPPHWQLEVLDGQVGGAPDGGARLHAQRDDGAGAGQHLDSWEIWWMLDVHRPLLCGSTIISGMYFSFFVFVYVDKTCHKWDVFLGLSHSLFLNGF